MNILVIYDDPGLIEGFLRARISVTCVELEDLPEYPRDYDCIFVNLAYKKDPLLLKRVRSMLKKTKKPYVIMGQPNWLLHKPILLCGTMFDSLRVFKHRGLESNVPLVQLKHLEHPPLYTNDPRNSNYGLLDEWKDYLIVTGGGHSSLEAAQDAMDITLNNLDLNKATPPPFTQWIGLQLKEFLS